MKVYKGTSLDGQAVHYVDRKRWLWTVSVLYPLQPFAYLWMHSKMGNDAWLLLPFALNYLLAPLLDWLIGEDSSNPPEEVVMQLEKDLYYRRLTYIIVPLHFLSFIICAAYATTQSMGWPAFMLLAAFSGINSGLAINTAHELGHKNTAIEKLLAKIVLAIPAYGHFTIDHNRGHHKQVSTYGDSSSSRMGETIYKFALREIPGSFNNAWTIEKERLQTRGMPIWHHSNAILQSYVLSLVMVLILLISFGWIIIPFLLIHHFAAYGQLTSANYIEHYGLLRKKAADGTLERCQPHHSWNSNHVFSNLVLFHLERHSDHHSYPQRRYQSLRHFDHLPTLPNGYFGMYLLAYFPSFWFKVMDKRLMALPNVDGDLNNVNIDRTAHPSLFLRWGRDKISESTYTNLPGEHRP